MTLLSAVAAHRAALCRAFAAACYLLPGPLLATPALDPVVVTATRAPQPITQALSSVTLISREEIERQPTGAVADLLRGAAGFELSRNGGPSAPTSLFLRGGDSRFTAVLIDGVRVDSQATGGATWQAIPLSQIERIEIVRGPASAIYGSDAIGGVVQIFTRRATTGFTPEIGLGIGSLATRKADAAVRGANGALDYAVSLAIERSRGFNAATDPTGLSGHPDREGYASRSAHARMGVKVNNQHRVELGATAHRLDAQYDAYMSADDDHSLQHLRTIDASWSARWRDHWSNRLSASEAVDRYETTPSPYFASTRIRTLSWQNDATFGAHTMAATLERREDRLLNNGLVASAAPDRGDRNENAVALGWGYRQDRFAWQANARHDSDSEFGGHTTGSLAIGFDVPRGFKLRGSAGTAFRAPTLYQRFSEYGNPSLGPERARNVELGLDWRRGSTFAGLSVWRNRVTDLIVYGEAGVCASSFGCYRNTARATLQGATLEARGEAGPVQLATSIDVQSPKDATTRKLLARRARRHAALDADVDVASWNLGARWLLASRRFDDAANTRTLAGYGLLHLNARWPIQPEWSLVLRLDNALDRDVQTAGGYAETPRSGFIGVRWAPVR